LFAVGQVPAVKLLREFVGSKAAIHAHGTKSGIQIDGVTFDPAEGKGREDSRTGRLSEITSGVERALLSCSLATMGSEQVLADVFLSDRLDLTPLYSPVQVRSAG
jgi:hypothetical protein